MVRDAGPEREGNDAAADRGQRELFVGIREESGGGVDADNGAS